jgi:hypothetical protein
MRIALCILLAVCAVNIQAANGPYNPRKMSSDDIDKYASQLITEIKNQLSPHISRLQKSGYALDAIPHTMRDVIETTLQNASINVVVALVNTLGKSDEKQWKPLVAQTIAFLLNKRFIIYFGLAQRFIAWLRVKKLNIEQTERIAYIFELDTTLYPILLKQLEVRNRHEKEPYTFADFLLMGNEEFLRSNLGVTRARGWFSSDSATLTLDGKEDSFIRQLTSLVGLRLIDKNIANKINRITIQNTALDTIVENELNHFPNLWRLELHANKISSILPNSFQGLNKLDWIDLSDNPLSESILEKLHVQLPNVTIDARHKIWWLADATWSWDARIWYSTKDKAEFTRWHQGR